jgi:hypothetical protein
MALQIKETNNLRSKYLRRQRTPQKRLQLDDSSLQRCNDSVFDDNQDTRTTEKRHFPHKNF